MAQHHPTRRRNAQQHAGASKGIYGGFRRAGIDADAAYDLENCIKKSVKKAIAAEAATLRGEMKDALTQTETRLTASIEGLRKDFEALRKDTKADIESLRKDIKISIGRLFWHLLLGGAALATLAVAFIDWLSRLR